MASLYTVVQYVPDPVTEERINIGVIVIGEDKAYAQFVDDWRRVSSFGGGKSVQFLRDFATQIEEAAENVTVGQLSLQPKSERPWIDDAILERMASSWINSIQLTPLKGSLDNPSELLDHVSKRFLRTPQRRERPFRDRNQAARVVREQVRDGLVNALGSQGTKLFRGSFNVPGEAYFHQVDAVVWNGSPRFAAAGLSFENPDNPERVTQLQLSLWAARDVRDRYPGLPFGVMVLEPENREDQGLVEVQSAIETVGAVYLREHEVEPWAENLAQDLREYIA